jgi:pimeloyl-ACP methyl ester carboxylesterase
VIAFSRSGSGPAVVLLHALGGDRTSWGGEVARLSDGGRTVLALDLPGHGATPAPSRVDLREIARAIGALVHQLDLAPAVVVGHSMGGTLAAHVALEVPTATRAMVVVDSQLARLEPPAGRRGALRQALAADPQRALLDFYSPLARSPAQAAALAEQAARVPVEAFLGYLEAMSEQGLETRAGAIAVPVQLIASIALEGASLAAAGFSALKDLRVDRIAGARHWIHLDQPAAYCAALDAFLASVLP